VGRKKVLLSAVGGQHVNFATLENEWTEFIRRLQERKQSHLGLLGNCWQGGRYLNQCLVATAGQDTAYLGCLLLVVGQCLCCLLAF
jgi:hypothetical protein